MLQPAAIAHDEGEESYLRRLGGAVIVHWDKLPDELRNTLTAQAALMLDRAGAGPGEAGPEEGEPLAAAIAAFVARHRGLRP